MPQWSIAAYGPEHQHGIVDLISGIQREEYQLPITPADQPDLMDIPGFYLHGAQGPGGFWVAQDAQGVVVGSIAVLRLGPDAAGRSLGALRKMFVAREQRGTGLAAALLGTLTSWCAGAGMAALYLGTTVRFLAAHRFYAKHGFARIAKDALPSSFPVMAVDTVFFTRGL